MARSKPLPERTRDEVLDYLPTVRQSILSQFDNCRLSTRWNLEGVAFDNPAQARGHLFHRYAAEVLRTLWRSGEDSMPTEEALVILYEIVAQRNVPDRNVVWLPAVERRLLRKCAISFVYDHVRQEPRRFKMHSLIAVEGTTMEGGEPLTIPVRYPETAKCPERAYHVNGTAECPACGGSGWVETSAMVDRTLTGRPDAIVGHPPDGYEILDWKTDRQPPPLGDEFSDHRDDAEHVSYGGYFQQRFYGVAALRRYPSAKWVRLRERYVLVGEDRWATIYREHMEHIERELAAEVELLDRGLMGGHKSDIWAPQPGKHCSYCPRPGSCPIPKEERGAGAITSQAMAMRYGAQAVVATEVRKNRIESMKAYLNDRPVDDGGEDDRIKVKTPPGIPVKSAKGRAEWRFRNGRFGLYVPEKSDRGPDDPALAKAFDEVKERRSAA